MSEIMRDEKPTKDKNFFERIVNISWLGRARGVGDTTYRDVVKELFGDFSSDDQAANKLVSLHSNSGGETGALFGVARVLAVTVIGLMKEAMLTRKGISANKYAIGVLREEIDELLKQASSIAKPSGKNR